jgi:hypothetical protein
MSISFSVFILALIGGLIGLGCYLFWRAARWTAMLAFNMTRSLLWVSSSKSAC